MTQQMSPHLPGDNVNDYIIGQSLEKSANFLWRAMSPDGSEVVLKRLTDPGKGYYHELVILASLRHPCIPPILATFEWTGFPYLVFPAYEGEDLFSCWRFSVGDVNNFIKIIFFRLMDVLVLLHSHQVWHRDLKPDNLMFKGGIPCFRDLILLDFGLATLPDDDKDWRYSFNVGTVGYQAPEIILGRFRPVADQMYNEKIDMFSLGLTLLRIESFLSPDPLEKYWLYMDKRMTPEKQLKLVHKIETGHFPNSGRLDPAFLDFLKGLCRVDPDKRLSAAEAIRHPWFDGVPGLIANRTVEKALAGTWNGYRDPSTLQTVRQRVASSRTSSGQGGSQQPGDSGFYRFM
jgi:serine/threonine protein kinase